MQKIQSSTERKKINTSLWIISSSFLSFFYRGREITQHTHTHTRRVSWRQDNSWALKGSLWKVMRPVFIAVYHAVIIHAPLAAVLSLNHYSQMQRDSRSHLMVNTATRCASPNDTQIISLGGLNLIRLMCEADIVLLINWGLYQCHPPLKWWSHADRLHVY